MSSNKIDRNKEEFGDSMQLSHLHDAFQSHFNKIKPRYDEIHNSYLALLKEIKILEAISKKYTNVTDPKSISEQAELLECINDKKSTLHDIDIKLHRLGAKIYKEQSTIEDMEVALYGEEGMEDLSQELDRQNNNENVISYEFSEVIWDYDPQITPDETTFIADYFDDLAYPYEDEYPHAMPLDMTIPEFAMAMDQELEVANFVMHQGYGLYMDPEIEEQSARVHF